MDQHSLSQILGTVFWMLIYAAKLNVAFGLAHKHLECGSFCCYYPHDSSVLTEQSRHFASAEELLKVKVAVSRTDVLDACTKKRANTKRKVYSCNYKYFLLLYSEIIPRGVEKQYCKTTYEKRSCQFRNIIREYDKTDQCFFSISR